MSGNEADSADSRYAAMANPKWAALFFFGGGAVLVVLGVLVRLLLGLSAASDRVFAVEALISGLAVIGFIHYRFGRKPLVALKLKIPFVYVWVILCSYVFFFRPFE